MNKVYFNFITFKITAKILTARQSHVKETNETIIFFLKVFQQKPFLNPARKWANSYINSQRDFLKRFALQYGCLKLTKQWCVMNIFL